MDYVEDYLKDDGGDDAEDGEVDEKDQLRPTLANACQS